MIECKFRRFRDPVTGAYDGYELTVQGHAGAAPVGQDVVCAYVSGIVQALGGYLLNAKQAVSPHVVLLSGSATISARGDLAQVFEMAYIGLLQAAESYPERVRVERERRKLMLPE